MRLFARYSGHLAKRLRLFTKSLEEAWAPSHSIRLYGGTQVSITHTILWAPPLIFGRLAAPVRTLTVLVEHLWKHMRLVRRDVLVRRSTSEVPAVGLTIVEAHPTTLVTSMPRTSFLHVLDRG